MALTEQLWIRSTAAFLRIFCFTFASGTPWMPAQNNNLNIKWHNPDYAPPFHGITPLFYWRNLHLSHQIESSDKLRNCSRREAFAQTTWLGRLPRLFHGWSCNHAAPHVHMLYREIQVVGIAVGVETLGDVAPLEEDVGGNGLRKPVRRGS